MEGSNGKVWTSRSPEAERHHNLGPHCPRAKLPVRADIRSKRLGRACDYIRELQRLQVEWVKLQEWVRHQGLRIVVLFSLGAGCGRKREAPLMLVGSGIRLIKYNAAAMTFCRTRVAARAGGGV